MNKFIIVVLTILLLPTSAVFAQETIDPLLKTNSEIPPVTVSELVVEKPAANFTIAKAQISGISGDVVTIVYTSGKRKVYDPIMVNPDTKILAGTKPITTKNLKVRQYIYVTGFKDGDVIQGYEINTVLKKIVPKPVVKKVVPVKKPTTPVVKKPVTKTPVKAATKK